MIARTKLLTFIISFLAFFSILVTLLGENGYIVNRELRARASVLEQREEKKRAEIDALKSLRDEEISTSEINQDYEVLVRNKMSDGIDYSGLIKEDETSFDGISKFVLAFFSAVFAFSATFIINFVEVRKNGSKDNRKE